MSKLPDIEAWAVFAKVAEARSFAGAAADMGVSKATVSKAVKRLEERLGARLFNRTSRKLSLTETGRQLSQRAFRILGEAEAAEAEAQAQSALPRGLVRLAAPMSFGIAHVAPALPEFFAAYPDVSIDLHLADSQVDLVGEGFDVGLRIAALRDSSLIARKLCPVRRMIVAAPSYLERRGRPTHPRDLADHDCFGYAYLATPDVWRFVHTSGEEVSVRPTGKFGANNGDAIAPALLAGLGIALQPDFLVAKAVADGRLETVLDDWEPPPVALNVLTPPGGPRPAKVEALIGFLVERFSRPSWQAP